MSLSIPLNILKKILPQSRELLAILAGFILFLSQYPLSWIPGLYIGMFIILFLIQKNTHTLSLKNFHLRNFFSNFLLGFCFGFGFFAATFYWIGFPFLVYAERLFFFIPFALVLFPALFALFFGAASALAAFFPHGASRLSAFVAFLALADFLRGHIPGGLPWNNFGYAWGSADTLMQSASLFGVDGVGVIAILLATLSVSPFLFHFSKISLISSALSISIFLSFHFWGEHRIQALQDQAQSTHNIKIRIIQPNISQSSRWKDNHIRQIFLRLLSLSVVNRPPSINHIIWPETATPFLLLNSKDAQQQIASITPPNGSLVTGAPRKDNAKKSVYYNSIVALDPSQRLIGTYDKKNLVPFGEYTPLGDFFSIDLLLGRLGSYTKGNHFQPLLTLPNTPPALPAICYESLFSHDLLAYFNAHKNKPKWILNATNDAWFGYSLAPIQHMEMSRWRSVELGIPLVRVNNTGRSGIINALGKPIEYRLTHTVGVIDFSLPQALKNNTTFSIIGFWGFFLPWGLLFLSSLLLSTFKTLNPWKSSRTPL
jgi:apolipoprotein N-acyltransferase